ncbi:MAG: hypothetical protein Q8K78_01995 [Planctomycetaceae bacterium]|nr:hypothetical protein [Planctomycetaceae bacterium]
MTATCPPQAQSMPAATWPRWITRRILSAIVVSFLVAFVFALRCDNDAGKLWLWNLKYPISGFWFIDYQMRLRWGRIWLIGIFIGTLVPDLRLIPRWNKQSTAD